MSNQSRMLLRALVGAYLIYLGGSLVLQVLRERPENMVLFAIAGVFFVAAGAAILVFAGKGYLKARKEDEEAELAEIEREKLETETEPESETETEPEVNTETEKDEE